MHGNMPILKSPHPGFYNDIFRINRDTTTSNLVNLLLR